MFLGRKKVMTLICVQFSHVTTMHIMYLEKTSAVSKERKTSLFMDMNANNAIIMLSTTFTK